MYVIFEGVDTTGKSTQVEFFAQRHKEVIATKEPGGTATGQKLRHILLEGEELHSFNAELFLFLADRALHYDTVVKEKRQTHTVISDRGFVSGISYAVANHPLVDRDFLLRLNRFALNEELPDKVVLFLTNEKLISSRLSEKEHDVIEKRGVSYLLQIQAIMREIIHALPMAVLEVDAALERETIYQQIEEFLYD